MIKPLIFFISVFLTQNKSECHISVVLNIQMTTKHPKNLPNIKCEELQSPRLEKWICFLI